MNNNLFEIFRIFFIIGIQLLGGGYVIVPLLKKYLIEERNWITEEELIDYYAMSQCIPGIIAGNIAICCGYKIKKTLGAVMAVAGIIVPSFLCIIILANVLINVVDNEIVQNAFWGIRIGVIVLIIITIRDIWSKSVNSKFSYVLYFIILACLLFLTLSPALIILLSALIGIIYTKLRGEKND